MAGPEEAVDAPAAVGVGPSCAAVAEPGGAGNATTGAESLEGADGAGDWESPDGAACAEEAPSKTGSTRGSEPDPEAADAPGDPDADEMLRPPAGRAGTAATAGAAAAAGADIAGEATGAEALATEASGEAGADSGARAGPDTCSGMAMTAGPVVTGRACAALARSPASPLAVPRSSGASRAGSTRKVSARASMA